MLTHPPTMLTQPPAIIHSPPTTGSSEHRNASSVLPKPSHAVVAAVGELPIEGNLTPQSWYQHPRLKHESGKVNLVAITILAEVLYWYRPVIVRDGQGGVLGTRCKFAADKLHISYSALAEKFGLTKRQVQDAVGFLKDQGLLSIELRDLRTREGLALRNLVYVEPIVEVLRTTLPESQARVVGKRCLDVQTPPQASSATPRHVTRQSVPPPTPERPYTETSGEIYLQRPTATEAAHSVIIPALPAAAEPVEKETISPPSEETTALAQGLIQNGVNRGDALRLAKDSPEECRKQLSYLPFVGTFKRSKGAYLRVAIEQGFAAPSGFEAAQTAQQRAVKVIAEKQRVVEEKSKGQEEKSRIEALKQALQQERPSLWQKITEKAHSLLPPPVRERPASPCYQPSLNRLIDKLIGEGPEQLLTESS